MEIENSLDVIFPSFRDTEFPEKEDLVLEKSTLPAVHLEESSFISQWLRDLIFLPLNAVDYHGGREAVAFQESVYRKFWFEKNPTCVYYGPCEEIKKRFNVFNQKILFTQPDGKQIQVRFRVYETKASENDDRPFANLLVYGGNISTLDNNLGGNLSEGFCHVNKYSEGFRLRILNFSVYDVSVLSNGKEEKYKPHCLDDLGLLMAKTMEGLHQEYPEIEGIICHSLTCIVFNKMLEFLKPTHLKIIPKLIVLDRGTSSVKKAATGFPLGGLLNAAAEYFGWSNKGELNLCNYFLRCSKKEPLKDRDIWVVTVQDDSYFKHPSLDDSTLRYLERLGIRIKNILIQVPFDKSSATANHARPRNEIGPVFGASISDMILTQVHKQFEEKKSQEKAFIQDSSKQQENPSPQTAAPAA